MINGVTSHFLHAQQGLHQGCLLSPLLFLPIVESLSHLVVNANCRDDFQGDFIPDALMSTYPLFVDDIIIVFNRYCRDVSILSKIVNLFGTTTSMLEMTGSHRF